MTESRMERTSERVMYRCRLCRQQLFDSTSILNTTGTSPPQVEVDAPTTTSPGASSSRTLEWSSPREEGRVIPNTLAFWAHHGGGGPSASPGPSGVLAPYGQVMAGPNPLWFINEDSTPPWVQRTLDKFQWKKGKLSCPKCYGRVGSFDFVTPHKLYCGSDRASRIHIMRSRVDCESSSPIIARIRPMPQSKLPGSSRALSREGRAAPQITSVERLSMGADNPEDMVVSDSAVLLTTTPLMPSQTELASTHVMPEPFSAISDEDTATWQNLSDYQREITRDDPVKQKGHTNSCPSRDPNHLDQPQTYSTNNRGDRHVAASISLNNPTFSSDDQNQIRRRVMNSRVPVDRPVSFGLHPGHSRNESDSLASGPTAERNFAYISGTNRTRERAQTPHPVAVSQHSMPHGNFGHYSRDNERHGHGQQDIWHYEGMVDAPEEEERNDRMRYYSSLPPPSTTSASSSAAHSRPTNASANIIRNSHAFLHPFVSRGVASERTRGPGSSGSQSPNLYSQVLHAEQTEKTTPSSREARLPSHTATSAVNRESEDDDDIGQEGEANSPHENGTNALQRSPREQRKERNRKKKERRKQRRYERWLERQTLGAEEESAIQDISAAGLYSLLGPRCAGSSLREVTTCSVCLDIYYQPHTCYPCEHLFCEPCLRQVTRFHPVVTPCPLCRTTIRTVKLHEQLTSAVKRLFPRQFENRHQMERRTLSRSFPLPGNANAANLPPWYRIHGYQTSRHQVDFLASRRNPGYVHDWGTRYLQGVVWRVVASTVVLLVVSGVSVGFLHFMFDFS